MFQEKITTLLEQEDVDSDIDGNDDNNDKSNNDGNKAVTTMTQWTWIEQYCVTKKYCDNNYGGCKTRIEIDSACQHDWYNGNQ